MNISRIVAKTALEAFGGEPKVFEYWDDDKRSSIDLLSTRNRPVEGITSFSTIGLSQHSIGFMVEDRPLRIEVVGACATQYEQFGSILATCAFNLINSNLFIHPGQVHSNVVNLYYPDYEMKHMLFVSPFLWEDSLKTLDFDEMKVAWLLAIPISENERLFAQERGSEDLETLFESEQIDIFDLERKTVVKV